MLRNEQAAYDAMHEVFVKILIYRHRLTGDHPSALLYRMATNICLNRIRDERKHALREDLALLHNMAFFTAPDDDASARLLFEYILKREKESIQRIAVMYFLDGMTLKEIAETEKLSISGVHKHLEKLRRRIKLQGDAS